ncbi:MAG: hypothetical protein F6K58_08400 [Symploca sp. SIO2E9]|nr:hypothetical protein [Symploca sp. SIO2E9]
MNSQLSLNQNFEGFITITAATSVAEALKRLEESQKQLAVVVNANQPQTLLQGKHLTALSSQGSKPLAELLEQLPSPLVVDSGVEVLETADLKQLGNLLKKTKAPGLIIYQNGEVSGIVPRKAIAQALPLDALTSDTTRSDLYGDSQVVARTYVCRQCNPPTYMRPRQGETPSCPKNWLHGNMEPWN